MKTQKTGLGKKTFELLRAAALAFSLAGCGEEQQAAAPAPQQKAQQAQQTQSAQQIPSRRYTGNEPWLVNGLRPGITFQEARQKLGEPTDVIGPQGAPENAMWQKNWTFVDITSSGIISRVRGTQLSAGQTVLMKPKDKEIDAREILGVEVVVPILEETGAATSSGKKQAGSAYWYENGGVEFKLTFSALGFSGVTAALKGAEESKGRGMGKPTTALPPGVKIPPPPPQVQAPGQIPQQTQPPLQSPPGVAPVQGKGPNPVLIPTPVAPPNAPR